MGDVAKVLAVKGYGRNRLFLFLREKKVLQDDKIPYQNYIDKEYFRFIQQKCTKPDGSTQISLKTVVYQKGRDYIRGLLGKNK